MIVGCPRCKKKLRVPDEKIKPGGSKFKCPGCSAVLLVRRPGEAAAKPPEREKAVAPVGPVRPVREVPRKPEEPKEPKEPEKEIPEPSIKPAIKPALKPVVKPELPERKEVLEPVRKEAVKPVLPEPEPDAKVERAKRLARTVLSDINLYQGAEVEESIRNNNFQEAFADALKEGLKLYGNKIAPDVRAMGDFYNEAVLNFIEKKKEALGL